MLAAGGPDYRIGIAGQGFETVAQASADPSVVSSAGYLINNMQEAYPLTNPDTVTAVLINLGAAEMDLSADNPAALPNRATWISQYESIITYLRSRFTNLQHVYLTYPWRRTADLEAAELHSRIDQIIADEGGFALAAVDEAIVEKNGDNGAAEMPDGTHYTSESNYGATVYAQAMAHVLGW